MTIWRWCAVTGLLAFAASFLFGRIPGLVACGPATGLGPILAFEFTRAPAEVAALFGVEPCRSTLAAAQRLGLLLDCLWFIPAYTAFLVLAVFASIPAKAGIPTGEDPRGSAFGAMRRVWAPACAGALLVAGVADEVEGAILSAILRDLPGTQALCDALYWAVRVKFALLALGTTAIGVLLLGRGRVGIVAGALVATGGLWALYGFLSDPARMMAGFSLGWIALLATAVTLSFAPSLFSGHAHRPPAPADPSA